MNKSQRGVWNREGLEKFKEKMGIVKMGEKEIGEEWESMERRIKVALKETEKELGGAGEKKGGWWGEEYKKKKGQVREELKEWRKIGGEGIKYKKAKQEYKKLCEEKEEEENRRWEKRAEKAKRK